MRDAIACVVHAKISHSPGGNRLADAEHQLYLNRAENTPLKGFIGDLSRRIRLELGIRMRYKIIRDDVGYRVTILAYDHLLIQSSGEVIVNFHWHPDGPSHEKKPHLHVGSSQLAPDAVLTTKIHVPTGRISVEQVIRQAIELGVEPLTDDWQKRLEESEAPFREHRTWG